METVALCGAAGFAGRAMLSALLDAGFRVKALDLDEASWTAADAHGRTRLESGLPTASDGQLELVYGDISEHAVVEALLAGCSAVVHTTVFFPQQVAGVNGGDTGLPDAIADETWRVNLKGLWNVLDCAQRSDTLRRVVHVGSCNTVWPGSTDSPGVGSVRFDGDVR
jgi:nucleoside-diphosphate-sugar epimerase|eukprot:COSAG06_NODE_613_length_13796_cov_45.631525_13_plen_167_part_00